MRIRKFSAATTALAMQEVRNALGENAIILSNSNKSGMVTLTAAIEDEDNHTIEESLFTPLHARNTPEPKINKNDAREEIISLLRFHNVPEKLAGKILYKLNTTGAKSLGAFASIVSSQDNMHTLRVKAMEQILVGSFSFKPLFQREHECIALVGPPGAGKTLTTAKLAAEAVMQKKEVLVITTDTKRAGGIEQLSAFTKILQVPINIAHTPSEMKSYIADADGKTIIIDTAGINTLDNSERQELSTFVDYSYISPILVLPAGMDAMETGEIAHNFTLPGLEKLIITRVDTARRFAGVLTAADTAGLAFTCISDSARVIGKLETATPHKLAQLLLHYQLEQR